MSQPISNNSPNDRVQGGGGEGGSSDPTVDRFHSRNQDRKRRLFRRIAEGAAFESGKQIAKDQELGEKLTEFLDALGGLF